MFHELFEENIKLENEALVSFAVVILKVFELQVGAFNHLVIYHHLDLVDVILATSHSLKILFHNKIGAVNAGVIT